MFLIAFSKVFCNTFNIGRISGFPSGVPWNSSVPPLKGISGNKKQGREGRKVGDGEKRRRGEKRGRGVRERKKQREKGRTRGKEEGGK